MLHLLLDAAAAPVKQLSYSYPFSPSPVAPPFHLAHVLANMPVKRRHFSLSFSFSLYFLRFIFMVLHMRIFYADLCQLFSQRVQQVLLDSRQARQQLARASIELV